MSSNKKLQGASGFLNLSGSLNIEDVFSTFVYTGTGSARTITNEIDLSNEGGLVWTMNRGGANPCLFDTATGTQKFLSSNSNGAPTDIGAQAYQFNDDGYQFLNSNVDNPRWNASSNEYVSWTFRKAPNFFDVVTYTGNGSNQNISHNLGTTPGFVIVKKTSGSGHWSCWHRSLPNTHYILLNFGNEAANGGVGARTVNDSVFQIFGSFPDEGSSGETYIMYLFGHDTSDEGIIQCGTFDTNASQHIPAVNLGFEPQWLMVKQTNSANSWYIVDTLREYSHSATKHLRAEAAGAEETWGLPYLGVPVPTGFDGQELASGVANGTFIYVAIRKGPMATPTSRADVFNLDSTAYTGADTSYPAFGVANFADFIMARNFNAVDDWQCSARLIGSKHIPITTQDEQTNTNITWDWMTGGWENAQFNNESAYVWTRAPGFFDVVTYTGNGNNNRTINHNLGVVPEMIWHKIRNENSTGYQRGWKVGSTHLGTSSNDKTLMLNTDAAQVDEAMFNDTPPTSSVFTVSSDAEVNANNVPYLACLFASVPGVSKIGVVSHTDGSTTDVDCGFSSGSYWVMFKRIDSTIAGGWYVYDVGFGINSGNEQFINFNSTSYFLSNSNGIDPLSSGFQIANGFFPTGDYLFYAMAN